MQPIVSSVKVISSHTLSDHDVITFSLSVRRYKPPAIHYTYRTIKNIDVIDFDSRLQASSAVVDPADTPDEFVEQL
jgi:hypothetical protein